MLFTYYDKVIRGTEHEDGLVIIQFLKGMVGQTFSFLNYYKEIPVSYDARLIFVENEMSEFEVHEYQAKVITLEKKALIRAFLLDQLTAICLNYFIIFRINSYSDPILAIIHRHRLTWLN